MTGAIALACASHTAFALSDEEMQKRLEVLEAEMKALKSEMKSPKVETKEAAQATPGPAAAVPTTPAAAAPAPLPQLPVPRALPIPTSAVMEKSLTTATGTIRAATRRICGAR